jgi:hypothetical protein
MSRRSHDLPGRSGNPVAGQRAAGGTFQNGFELVGHVMYKSCLILRAMEWFSGKPSAINVARSVWEGADEKGPAMVPRQPPTSFVVAVAVGRVFVTGLAVDFCVGLARGVSTISTCE